MIDRIFFESMGAMYFPVVCFGAFIKVILKNNSFWEPKTLNF